MNLTYLLTYSFISFQVGIIDDFKIWLLEKIQAVIDFIRGIFFDIFQSITEFIKAFLLTLLDALKDFFYFIFDALLSLLVNILSSLVSAVDFLDITNYMGDMPYEVINIMGLLGLGQCMGMIIASLIIRMSLQLIPFTRLGS